MKISTVRSILIRQSVIVTVVLSFFGGIMWYIESLSDEFNEKINYLQSQVNNVTRQAMDLSSEYGKVTDIMDEYHIVRQKQDNKMLDVDKIILRDVLADFRRKYSIDISEVKMSEIKALSGEKYKRDAVFIESGDVEMNFSAISDLDIFTLIQGLEKSFSSIKFTSVEISALKELNSASLSEIKNTGFASMVGGKISFTLFGLRNISSGDNELLIKSSENTVNNGMR